MSTKMKLLLKEVPFERLKFRHPLTCAHVPPEYFPLELDVLMLGVRLTFTTYIKVSVDDGKVVKFLPYCQEGEILEKSDIAPLKECDIQRLFFYNHDLDKVIAYLNNYVMLLQAGVSYESSKILKVMREHLSLSLRRAFNAIGLENHLHTAQQQVDGIILELQKNRISFQLIQEILCKDYSIYSHSVNVCLLGVALMLFADKSDTKRSNIIGLAGLFHDLGMTWIPEDILFKNEALTQEDRKVVEHHPLISFRKLKNYPTLPLDSIRLILEHHENADGSGYPKGLELHRQHPLTRIFRLIDAYDAITANRPYRGGQTAFKALNILKNQCGPRGPVIDRKTLANFIKFLSLI